MAADYVVGDIATLTYNLRDPITQVPTNATVTATALLLDDGATTAAVSVTNAATGVYVGAFAPSKLGVWRVTFTASGTLTDVTSATVFFAAATDAPPPWSPSLRQVAAYVPTRTRAIGVDNTYLGTFTSTTEPTDSQVAVLIGSASSLVSGRLGTIVSAAYSLATTAAALWAAYWVELAYPERDNDVTTAAALRQDAVDATTWAFEANIAAGGGGTIDVTGEPATLVAWAFLAPPRYADITIN